VLVAGIDEAGRGCVIGPLVIAGILIKQENLPALKQLGVKDSKLLTAKKREKLLPQILDLTEKHVIIKVSPAEIDHVVENGKKLYRLNRLEADNMAKIVNMLQPDEAQVDAVDVLEERFKRHIEENLTVTTNIISKHKADINFPAVSAASIIAKVNRDHEIAMLAAEYGDFGTGYLADGRSMIFLKKWLESNDDYPDFVRRSWKPAKRIKAEKCVVQQTLV
jgi:ribonuclease HII